MGRGPDLLVVSRPLRSNPILRETTTGSGPKTNVWKLTSRHYSVAPSSRRAGVGPTLSVNVLSFQTSLETWTTAAIIFGGWSLRSHCKFGNESVVDYESWARESTDVPKDNICVFVFYYISPRWGGRGHEKE